MRFFIFLFLTLVLLLEGLLFLLFTAPGNDLLLPFANRYLAQKVPQAKIVLTTLRLKPDSLGIIAQINDSIHAKAKGDIDLFDQTFDINYTVQAREIKTPTLTIKENLRILGNARGNTKQMQIQGRGDAFKSDIRYSLTLADNIPKDVKLDVTDADLRSLLTVTGQPPYSTGLLSLHAGMPVFRPLNPQIDARFSIRNGTLNSTQIAHDFNITLPKKSRYTTHFVVKTEKGHVAFDGSLNSNLANLALKRGRYHLLHNTLSTDYHLIIPKLEKLSGITKAPLRGELILDGTAALKNTLPTVTGNSKSFGGNIDLSYRADTLTATLDKIHNATLLYKLGQPKYLSGNSTASVTLKSLKNLTGSFKLQTQGSVNTQAVKKAFDLDLGKKFTLSTGLKGKIAQQKVSAVMLAKTTMANLKLSPLHYDLKQSMLTTTYLLDLPDMGRLQPLTGKRFKGKMRLNGTVKKGKSLRVTGHGKEFGGRIDFTLADDRLKADASGVTVSKLMTMLDYPQMLEAISKAQVDYSLTSQSGTLHATLDNARLLPTQLTALLKQFQIIDLTKERYNNSRFDASISKQKIDFTMEAKSKNSYLRIPAGTLIKKSGTINAKVDLKIKGKDLQATIRGTTDHPKVSLDGSRYLQDLAKEKLKKKFGGKVKKVKKKLKKKLGKQLKNLGGGLF